ncbi:MAG: Ig-like domain-containing protein [Bacteroidales bacterium]|nr:Ig-like domain-containing protein [Candidatus Sodaliphilus limicaballi]
MKKFSITLLSLFLTAVIASAQVIKGDMNDDGVMDIGDLNESVNTVLGKRAIQYVQGGGDPYMVDNSRVVGTWYKTKSDHFTLNEDGTTDYSGAATYCFMPYQGRIVFFGADGVIMSALNVILVGDGLMITNELGSSKFESWTTEVPAQPVTAIRLSATSLEMHPDEFKPMLTATVLPADADNKAVTWSSSNESVVKLSGDLILAMGNGTATITCSATDGSGVKAECTVTVKNKDDRSGKDSAGREYIDLGLPGGVLWATYNVGADKPEDYGLYFAWGETVGYANGESHGFDWDKYKWMIPGQSSWPYVTKYTTADGHKSCCWYDGDTYVGTNVDGVTYKNLTKLLPEDDAATANWGNGWRMPTMQEMKDLYDSKYTSTEWVTVNGVSGRKVTSKSNGNSIFLPAAGCYIDTSLYNDGSDGYYWSGELDSSRSYYAYYLYFFSDFFDQGNDYRYHGLSVRPVRVLSE